MSISTITSKGQTTIPLEIRAHLSLHPGDKIEFIIENGKVMIAPLTISVADLKGVFSKPRKKLTIDEMNQIIRKRASEWKK